HVTGVQTCALPIYLRPRSRPLGRLDEFGAVGRPRSDERRLDVVGDFDTRDHEGALSGSSDDIDGLDLPSGDAVATPGRRQAQGRRCHGASTRSTRRSDDLGDPTLTLE